MPWLAEDEEYLSVRQSWWQWYSYDECTKEQKSGFSIRETESHPSTRETLFSFIAHQKLKWTKNVSRSVGDRVALSFIIRRGCTY